jgi:hypothetical protein
MTSKKQAFLDHLSACRQTVAQWPQWKQDFFKPVAATQTQTAKAKQPDNRPS